MSSIRINKNGNYQNRPIINSSTVGPLNILLGQCPSSAKKKNLQEIITMLLGEH